MTSATQNTVRVEVQRKATSGSHADSPGDLQADIERVRMLAVALDSQFEIAGFKFGWDAIVGLVPVAGDLAMAVIGAYPVLIARKHKLGKWVQARMAWNLFVDWLIGEIPLLGDIFDAAFKVNLKNLALLERAAKRSTK